jgi:hypothetical protein
MIIIMISIIVVHFAAFTVLGCALAQLLGSVNNLGAGSFSGSLRLGITLSGIASDICGSSDNDLDIDIFYL